MNRNSSHIFIFVLFMFWYNSFAVNSMQYENIKDRFEKMYEPMIKASYEKTKNIEWIWKVNVDAEDVWLRYYTTNSPKVRTISLTPCIQNYHKVKEENIRQHVENFRIINKNEQIRCQKKYKGTIDSLRSLYDESQFQTRMNIVSYKNFAGNTILKGNINILNRYMIVKPKYDSIEKWEEKGIQDLTYLTGHSEWKIRSINFGQGGRWISKDLFLSVKEEPFTEIHIDLQKKVNDVILENSIICISYYVRTGIISGLCLNGIFDNVKPITDGLIDKAKAVHSAKQADHLHILHEIMVDKERTYVIMERGRATRYFKNAKKTNSVNNPFILSEKDCQLVLCEKEDHFSYTHFFSEKRYQKLKRKKEAILCWEIPWKGIDEKYAKWEYRIRVDAFTGEAYGFVYDAIPCDIEYIKAERGLFAPEEMFEPLARNQFAGDSFIPAHEEMLKMIMPSYEYSKEYAEGKKLYEEAVKKFPLKKHLKKTSSENEQEKAKATDSK